MKKYLGMLVGMFLMVGMTNAQVFLSEDFNGCALPLGWQNVPTDTTFVWEFVLNSSDPFNAGNLDGTCMVLFDDDAIGSGAVNAGAQLTSPSFDGTGAPSTVQLEFDYNFRSLGTSFFIVEVFNGASWDTVFTRTGTSDCGAWTCGPDYPKANIDVTSSVNAAMQLRFSYGDGGSFAWWAAFDNVVVRGLLPNDAGVTAITAPTDGCGLGTESVSAVVTNFGGDTIPNIRMRLAVDGGTPIVEDIVGANLAPGATLTHNYAATADLSALGPHTVTCSAQAFPTDDDPSNDALTATVTNIVPAVGLTENFDSWTLCSTSSTCTIVCPAENGWTNDGADGQDWRTGSGTTVSTGTGPTGDNTTDSTNYMYLETSSTCDTGYLVSPCLDISGFSIPGLEFYYHMFGATMGTLGVDVSTDNGASWTNIFSLSGQQQDSTNAAWKKATVPLAAYSGVIILRFVGVRGSSFTSDMCIDDIEVLDLPATGDVGVVSIDSPAGDACDFTSTETVTVTVQNLGTVDVSSFSARVSVDGGPSALVNYAGPPVPPLGTASLTFAATVDLSADGAYEIAAWSQAAGDANPFNDTTVAIVNNLVAGVTSLPFTEDFESYTDGTNTFADWTNETSSLEIWEAEVGNTTSTGTGPIDAATPGGTYAYIESSGALNGDIAKLQSPCIDLTGATAPRLNFLYHMYGNSIGGLRVDVISLGGVVTNELTLTGQQDTSDTDPWNTALVDLSAYVGQNIQICITGEVAVDTADGITTFRSDIAIDEIVVEDPVTNDAGALNIVTPVGGGCLGTAEVVSARVKNFGLTSTSGITMEYQIAGGAVVSEPWAVALAPGADTIYVFSTPGDFSGGGSIPVLVSASATGDGNTSNDAVNDTVEAGTLITVLPFVEDFESYTDGTNTFAEWTNTTSDLEIWEAEIGNTSSIGTGPIDADDPGGTYAYIESSGALNGDIAKLVSPCIDLSGAVNPRLNFLYHMYGNSIGGLRVDVISSGVTTNELTLVGQQDISETDPWNTALIDLSAYIGQQIQICITGEVAVDTADGITTFRSDIAIDEIIVEDPVNDDMAAVALVSPVDGCLGSAETVTFTAKNFGLNPTSGIQFSYQVDGGTPVTEVTAIVLAPGADTTFTFATPADLSAAGPHAITVCATAAGEDNPANDCLTDTVNNQLIVPPFSDDFESYAEGVTTFDNGLNISPDLNWETETGTTPSTATGPSDDASGAGGQYIYMESSGSIIGEQASLSYCVDLSGVTSASLTYAYHMYGGNCGSLSVIVITGTSDTIRVWEGQQQASSAAAWGRDTLDLSAYAGGTLELQFVGEVGVDTATTFTFNGDIALDEIGLDASTAVCSAAIPPQNPGHTDGASKATLFWDAVPLSVACQVKGTRLVPPGPSPTVNLFGSEPTTTNVPYAVLNPGDVWTWQVRCACSTSPVIATGFSVADTFMVPAPPKMGQFDEELNLFPNPADQFAVVTITSEKNAEEMVVVSDLLGRTLKAVNWSMVEGENNIRIDLSDLEDGVYFIGVGARDAIMIEVSH